MHADLILTGGIVRAISGPYAGPSGPPPTAIAVHGGRILAQRSTDAYVGFRVELPVAVKSSIQSELTNIPNRAVAGGRS